MTGSASKTGAQHSAPLTQSLEQIEGAVWPMPCCASYIETTCAALRKKPIGQFTTEDLRIMIAQDIGVEVLKPLVLEVLRDDPMAEGDYYPGDLLDAAHARWPKDAALAALHRIYRG